MSLFSPALHTLSVSNASGSVDLTASGGWLMANHLIRMGSTVVISLEQGQYHAAIGRDGVLSYGNDFVIEAGRGYVINALDPIELVMDGAPNGSRIIASGEGAPATGSHTPWVF